MIANPIGTAISLGGSLVGKLFGKKGKNKMKKLELPDFMTGWSDFNRQFPAVRQAQGEFNLLADQNNKWYRESLGGIASGLLPALEQQSQTALSLSRGEIPEDVVNQISEQATRLNMLSGGGGQLTGGVGGLSRLFGTRGSVDLGKRLGLTSLDLQMRGASLLPQVLNMSQALTPYRYDAAQYMITPREALARRDNQAIQNWNVDNYNRTKRRNIWDTVAEIATTGGMAISAIGGGRGGLFGGGLDKGRDYLPVWSSGGGLIGQAPREMAPYGRGYTRMPGGGLAAVPYVL
jgi:hypothetical protein